MSRDLKITVNDTRYCFASEATGLAVLCARLDTLIELARRELEGRSAINVVHTAERTAPRAQKALDAVRNLPDKHLASLRERARHACGLCGGVIGHAQDCPARVFNEMTATTDQPLFANGGSVDYSDPGTRGGTITFSTPVSGTADALKLDHRDRRYFVLKPDEIEVTDEMIEAFYEETGRNSSGRSGREAMRGGIKAAIEKMPRRVAKHPALGASYGQAWNNDDGNIVLRWLDQAKNALWSGQSEHALDAYNDSATARDAMLRFAERHDALREENARLAAQVDSMSKRDDTLVDMGLWAPKLPRWVLEYATEIERYMSKHHAGPWCVQGIQSRTPIPPFPTPVDRTQHTELREHVRATDADERDAGKWRGLMAEVSLMPAGELACWIAVLKRAETSGKLETLVATSPMSFTRLRCLLEVIFNEHQASKKENGNGR